MKVHRAETKKRSMKVDGNVYVTDADVGTDDGGNRHAITVIGDGCTDENGGNYLSSTNLIDGLQQVSADKQDDEVLPTIMGSNAVAVRNDELSEMIKFGNADFMNVDPTAIAVVHNGVLDDSFNAFSYHFQM